MRRKWGRRAGVRGAMVMCEGRGGKGVNGRGGGLGGWTEVVDVGVDNLREVEDMMVERGGGGNTDQMGCESKQGRLAIRQLETP